MAAVAQPARSVDYDPRPQLLDFHNRSKRWAAIVAHRRFGKTVGAVMDTVTRAAATKKTEARYAYVAPFREQAKLVAWNYLKRYAEPLVSDPDTDVRESDLSVRLFNGSVIRLFGSDNPNALRGMYLDGVVMDEPADMRPSLWGEVIRPMLADRIGWATFIGTPKGKNSFWKIYDEAGRDPNWYRVMIRASETGLLSAHELADARRTMTESQYQQEFECSFEAAIVGAIYAREIELARERITAVPYDPSLLVNTAWDIGYGDSTAIWFWQVSHGSVRIIDYYEAAGERIPFYLQMMKGKPYNYDTAYMPHDAANGQLTGLSVIELMQANGVKATVLPRISLEDGINAARMLLPVCSFDAIKCAPGIEALRAYQWAYNERMGETKPTPIHNWASHGCFEGTTNVWTRYGTCQIMDLPENGEVLTSCGWKPYTQPRITRRNAPLVEVVFRSGYSVRCTPDHLFKTASGWRCASDLTPNTLILSFSIPLRSISMVAYIGSGLRRFISRAGARNCIVMRGPLPLGQFPRDVISTIAIATRQTMDSQILSAYLQKSTFPTTGKNTARAESFTSRSVLAMKRLLGINLRPGVFGTAETRSDQRAGQSGNASRVRARAAALRSTVSFVTAAIRSGFAAIIARPQYIAHVNALDCRTDVWDLTVPSLHEFALANGALVHNSDSFRYLAQAYRSAPGAAAGDGLKLPKLSYGWNP